MMKVLEVQNLTKHYPAFTLDNVCFSVNGSSITGFIGRNGAGKTTTLKSLLNFVHPDSGTISFFGKEFSSHEAEIKQEIGFVTGGISYYPNKKLSAITKVTKKFYTNWDEESYKRNMARFNLDENKRPKELSAGMKVKYQLALALSHKAKLLILDEPTSGLDPVSRDELLELLLRLRMDDGVSILFSTHITSDLEKCADHIIYIKGGRILDSRPIQEFRDSYKIVRAPMDQWNEAYKEKFIGYKYRPDSFEGLIRTDEACSYPEEWICSADLESIMVFTEKEDIG